MLTDFIIDACSGQYYSMFHFHGVLYTYSYKYENNTDTWTCLSVHIEIIPTRPKKHQLPLKQMNLRLNNLQM